METAFRQMQFDTILHHIRIAQDALVRALDGVDTDNAVYVMAQCQYAQNNSQIASFLADNLLLLAEQEETVLFKENPNGATNTGDQAPGVVS